VPHARLDTVMLVSPSTRLDYQYGGIRITGRLLGPDGKALTSGSVGAMGFGPDRIGFHVASRLVKGRYTLFVPPASPACTTYYFKTEPGPGLPCFEWDGMEFSASADTTIDLSANGHLIEGKVTVRNGMPLPFAALEVRGQTLPEKQMVFARNTTKRDGSYHFYLPTGGYSLFVKPGLSTRFVLRRILPFEVTVPGTIDMDLPGVEWTGIVRDSVTGSPLKNVAVTAFVTWFNEVYQYFSAASTSDGRGRFRLVLEPGRTYVLSLSRADGRIAPKEIRGLVAGNDSTFDLLVQTTAP
jgi:hypothetical protein